MVPYMPGEIKDCHIYLHTIGLILIASMKFIVNCEFNFSTQTRMQYVRLALLGMLHTRNDVIIKYANLPLKPSDVISTQSKANLQ